MVRDVLDHKYAIERLLGEGGMGAVYLATHLGTKRQVALKVIDQRHGRDPEFLARFQREAEAAGRLRHPNVVNVTDFGSTTTPRGTIAYLVMEYLEGLNLADYQKQYGALPVALALDLVDQISSALDEAHEKGIVHRDLKPENIWLEPNRRGGFNVKVLDFGIAKMIDSIEAPRRSPPSGRQAPLAPATDSGETLLMSAPVTGQEFQTTVGSIIGTPAFMSPEQCSGGDVGPRSDIYSLGVVAFSMLTGKLPFEGRTSDLLLVQHITERPPAPHRLNKKSPKLMSEAVLSALAKAPEDRPATAKAYAELLRATAEAETPILRQAKLFPVQHVGFFATLLAGLFFLLPCLFVLVELPVFRAYRSHRIGETVTWIFIYLLLGATLLVAGNLIRGAVALLATGRIRQLPGRLVVLMRTQLGALTFWESGRWAAQCLWPVVCAVEGISGKPAFLRSAKLVHPLRHVAFALQVRHYGPVLCFLLLAHYDPFIGGVLSKSFTKTQFLWFLFAKLPLLAAVQLLYSAAPYFLYRRALRVEGLAEPEHSATAKRLELKPRWFHVATIGWLAAPFLLYVMLKSRSIEGFLAGFRSAF
jgi:serine/threonine protein kinase